MRKDSVICYIPLPEGQLEGAGEWLSGLRGKYGIIPVALTEMDWNDDLTPWPSGPVFRKGKPFGGRAASYLERLGTEIIPSAEAGLGAAPDERWLVGVSLAGLFAVWAASESALFTRIGAVSGSFWYPGFTEWLAGRDVKADSAYVSLGDREAAGRNPHLQTIAEDTAEVVSLLETKGVPTRFEWTAGTHFGPVFPRLEKAIASLAGDE